MAKSTPQENVDDMHEAASLESSWVFLDREAPVSEVRDLLASVTVPYSDLTMDRYLPYVLPMSNRQKVKTPDPNNPQRDVESYVRQTTLYTQVAGRLRILADVASSNGWKIDIYPEPNVPTGIPGYLRFDDRLVFRVYVEITSLESDGGSTVLGRRFGTAWAKAEGGFNAEGSNPYETVETSALGRALAQWGFGILPGSGIASVEEMRLAKQNVGGAGPRARQQAPQRVKEDRGDLIASAVDFIERRRKMTGASQEDVDAGMAKWVRDKLSIDGFVTDGGGYDWTLLTDAQITLLRNATRDAVVAATAAGDTAV